MIRRRLNRSSRGLASTATVTGAMLVSRALAKSHPRTVNVAAIVAGTDYDLRWTSVQTRVTGYIAGTPGSDLLANYAVEGDAVIECCALWLRIGTGGAGSGDAALAQAKIRINNLVTWNPVGVTGYQASDTAGSYLTYVLAMAYDWVQDQLSAGEKSNLLAHVKTRLWDIIDTAGNYALTHGTSMSAWPYNSHVAATTGKVASVCVALAGHDGGGAGDIYNQGILDIVPNYLARPIWWGGQDGGYSNGSDYAMWDNTFGHFMYFSHLQEAVAVDLWATPWAINYIKHLVYFLPPGRNAALLASPNGNAGVFGDGAEIDEWSWGTQAKAYRGYSPTALSNWYAKNSIHEAKFRQSIVFSPQVDLTATYDLPAGTPEAALLADVGWVAMHSSLANLTTRSSLYFKSSAYGSYNHSHADQNSFTIHLRTLVVAADSGYYDSYGTAHWQNWYKKTVAHNAMTYDNGTGQTVTATSGDHAGMNAKGVITQFETSATYDITTGDALAAYAGLTKAVRSIVYLRSIDAFVIFDSVASGTARMWEWNIHALLDCITENSDTDILITNTATLRVRMIDSPAVRFDKHNTFESGWGFGTGSTAAYNPNTWTGGVTPSATHPRQDHGRFSVTSASTSAVFVTLLEVGAGGAAYGVSGTGQNRVVTIGGKTLTFNGTGVTVT